MALGKASQSQLEKYEELDTLQPRVQRAASVIPSYTGKINWLGMHIFIYKNVDVESFIIDYSNTTQFMRLKESNIS